MESWLEDHRLTTAGNLGESGVADLAVGELLELVSENESILGDVWLADEDTRG